MLTHDRRITTHSEDRFIMQIDRPGPAGDLLPLRDAVILAPTPFWDNFPVGLLDRRVSVAKNHEDLVNIESGKKPVIVVLDDGDIQNHVHRIWADPFLKELVVVLPAQDTHIAGIKSLSSNTSLSECLQLFTRYELILALKFSKQTESEWDLQKLLAAISVLSQSTAVDNQLKLDQNFKDRIVDHLEILEQLIELTATNKEDMLESESIDLEQLRKQNARLQSNNASMRLQIDTLQRKYDALANSRLGRITLKRWGRK